MGNSDPDAVLLVAAYKPDGHLYIYGLEEEPVRVTEQPVTDTYALWGKQRFNYNHIWSPDGAYLVFVGQSDLPGSLGVYELATAERWYLDAHAASGVPMSFSLDGQHILYPSWATLELDGADASYGYQDDSGQRFAPVLARQIALAPDSEAESLREIAHVGYLGGGLTCPPLSIYEGERLFQWDFGGLLLETPHGLLYGRELHFSTMQDDNMQLLTSQSAVSSDKNQLAVIVERQTIRLINLADETYRDYNLAEAPEFLAWSADNRRLYYPTIEVSEDFSEQLAEDRVSPLWYYDSCSYRSNKVSIRQLNLSDGSQTELLNIPAFAITSLMPDPQGNYLYFSAIPDTIEAWMGAMTAGECTDECRDFLFPDLYRLNLQTGEQELLLDDVIKPSVNFGVGNDGNI